MIFTEHTRGTVMDFVDLMPEYMAYAGPWLIHQFFLRGWEYSAVCQLGDFQPDDVVLDVGGARSYLLPFIMSRGGKQGFIYDLRVNYDALYSFWFMTLFRLKEYLDGKVVVINGNAGRLPFRDCYFDKIITVSAFEHFGYPFSADGPVVKGASELLGHGSSGEDSEAAREVYRVLKPQGLFLGSVDFNPLGSLQSLPRYTLESFTERIVNAAPFKLVGEVTLPEFPVEDTDFAGKMFQLFFVLTK